MAVRDTRLKARGFLLHLTTYGPRSMRFKSRERPFDLDTGLAVIDAMAEAGLNILVVECGDAVIYKSHPELGRPYSVPMSRLRALAKRAQSLGIDVVPKLNFAESEYHKHGHWFRPHNEGFYADEYMRIAFELVDELIETCESSSYFHIGMDEDHNRAISQYIDTIMGFRDGLKDRGLRTIIWNDSSHGGFWSVHAEKCIAAEKVIPRDVVQVPWDYDGVKSEVVQRLVGEGFEVWGAPGREPQKVRDWKRVIEENGGGGLLLTTWSHCRKSNRSSLLKVVKSIGPICSE